MSEIRIDFETRSDVDLKRCGAARYFASPYFRALGASYSINGGPIEDWEHGLPCPDKLRREIELGATIRAFNAAFERHCFNTLAERCGWPRPAIDRYRCTEAEAAAMSLPRSLDDLGEALGLTVRKDKDGRRLIRKFSLPRRPREDEDPNGVYFNEPEDHPEDYAKFVAYRRRDVETESEAASRLVRLSDDEQAVYVLDQIINDRGIRIDRRSARAALVIAEKAKKRLDQEMRICTNGYVPSCTTPAKLVEWVQNQGVYLDSAAKAELSGLLELDDLPAHVRRAIELRQEAAKTSVQKLRAMLDRASADGRVRGTSIYHGASTGRWVNVGVNFYNMPRPRKIFEDAKLDPAFLFSSFRSEDIDLFPLLFPEAPKPDSPEIAGYLLPNTEGMLGRPLHLISDAIRGFIWSAPGHELIQADYSGIEGAVIAWSSGEHWKVQALHDIIADPTLPDMYRQTAASIMNTTPDVITKKHPLRQSVGKVSELALGFGGGVSAFYSMARNYRVKLHALYGPVWGSATEERREKAIKRYESCLKRKDSKTDVLSREAWLACELIKVGWRGANAAIAEGWKTREQTVREAVQNPGTIFSCLKFSCVVKMGFLWWRLPSGRCLAYGAPRLKDQVWARLRDPTSLGWLDAEVMDREIAERLERRGDAKIDGATLPKVTVLGVDGATKQWRRYGLYGGLEAENDTQAVARDLLVNGMRKAEAAGYPVITTVYDEILCEVPRGFGDLAAFERLICELPPWAAGVPLTAGGWRGKRYRKD